MSSLADLFKRNLVECPRCLGKGQVDATDIKRLKKIGFWLPGKCAYCNGKGSVPSKRISNIAADAAYLTTTLPVTERIRLLNGDAEALQRAQEYEAAMRHFISEIENMYFIENMEPDGIAEYLLMRSGVPVADSIERSELIGYIEKVIKDKINPN